MASAIRKKIRGKLHDIKFLIVDMDNTLCDTMHTLSKAQWVHAAAVLEKHGIPKAKGQRMLKLLGKYSFRSTIEKIGLDDRLRKIAVDAYDDVDVTKLKMFDDAQAILEYPLPKVLLTRGEPSLQRAKIAHLKLRKHFKKVYFVKTFDDKKDVMEQIRREYKLHPHEILVIGDRVEEEIKDGNILGMHTALIDRPDWPSHPSVSMPDITVKNLWHLKEMLDRDLNSKK